MIKIYNIEEISKLISKYNQLLHDHQYPIDLSTREQHHLEGYDAALKRVVYDLKEFIKNSKECNHEVNKLSYT